MVKRKADKSLDEWLMEAKVTSDSTQTNAVGISEGCTPEPAPTVVEVTTAETIALEPIVSTDVATDGDREPNWLWELLAQAGYEMW